MENTVTLPRIGFFMRGRGIKGECLTGTSSMPCERSKQPMCYYNPSMNQRINFGQDLVYSCGYELNDLEKNCKMSTWNNMQIFRNFVADTLVGKFSSSKIMYIKVSYWF